MLFPWLDHDNVARADVPGRLAPFLDANPPVDDQKPLGARVAMPVSPSARVELDAVDEDRNPAHLRRDLSGSHAAGKALRIDGDWLEVVTAKIFHDRTINQRAPLTRAWAAGPRGGPASLACQPGSLLASNGDGDLF